MSFAILLSSVFIMLVLMMIVFSAGASWAPLDGASWLSWKCEAEKVMQTLFKIQCEDSGGERSRHGLVSTTSGLICLSRSKYEETRSLPHSNIRVDLWGVPRGTVLFYEDVRKLPFPSIFNIFPNCPHFVNQLYIIWHVRRSNKNRSLPDLHLSWWSWWIFLFLVISIHGSDIDMAPLTT